MSWFSQWLHPGDAYKKAGEVENSNFNQSQQMRQPYIQQGQDAYGGLNDMYQKLMHPEQLQNEWANSYSKSPYAQNMQEEARGAGMDAASQNGLIGSSAAISNIQKGASNIADADRQKYMDDMMQKYLSAMGLGSSLYGTGANFASQAAQGQQQHGENQANLTYGQNSAGGNRLGNIASSIPMLIAAMYSGRGMPAGNAAPWINPDTNKTYDQMYGGGGY